MPTFSYQGFDKTGTSETGTIEASNEKLAFDTLQARGITVFELTQGRVTAESALPWYRRDIQFSGTQLSYQDQAQAADLLATLFEAKLPASEVFRVAAISAEKADLKRQFERIEQRLTEGNSIAQAFAEENRYFSPIFVSFMDVSDASNELPSLLRALSAFFQRQDKAQKKIQSALIYPAILLIAAMALLAVVTFYLAPNLEQIFTSAGQEPPATLAFLLRVNALLGQFWLPILASFGGAILGSLALLQVGSVKRALSSLRYRLPLFGTLAKSATLSRLAQAASLLLTSGQSLPDALRTSGRAMGQGSSLGARFGEAADAIEAGYSASEVLSADAQIPATFRELFAIGERTNRLPETLASLSVSLAEQTDRQAERFLLLLTPAITLVMGIGIGLLVYTLMGAILDVNDIAI